MRIAKRSMALVLVGAIIGTALPRGATAQIDCPDCKLGLGTAIALAAIGVIGLNPEVAVSEEVIKVALEKIGETLFVAHIKPFLRAKEHISDEVAEVQAIAIWSFLLQDPTSLFSGIFAFWFCKTIMKCYECKGWTEQCTQASDCCSRHCYGTNVTCVFGKQDIPSEHKTCCKNIYGKVDHNNCVQWSCGP